MSCNFFLHALIVPASRCECVAVLVGVGDTLARIRGIRLGLARLPLARFTKGMCSPAGCLPSAEDGLDRASKRAHCTGSSDCGPAST